MSPEPNVRKSSFLRAARVASQAGHALYAGRIITQAEVAAQWNGQSPPTSSHSQYDSMLSDMNPHDLAELRRGRMLGVCTYNPQHFYSAGRMAEVMHILDRYQIQIFPGTRLHAQAYRGARGDSNHNLN